MMLPTGHTNLYLMRQLLLTGDGDMDCVDVFVPAEVLGHALWEFPGSGKAVRQYRARSSECVAP
eukprot:1789949-Rhodomonas_salina.1